MAAKQSIREYFLACRTDKGVRESVRETAKYHNTTTEHVCKKLGLDMIWSDKGREDKSS